MPHPPLVSVVIPFLNAARFLDEAIQSVLAQTYGNWELILVDDGSTDESSGIARGYANIPGDAVRYVAHDGHRNKGTAASRNVGVRLSAGEYVAFLDADDVWFPVKLERQIAIARSNPRAGMVVGSSQYWHSWTTRAEDASKDYVRDSGIAADRLYMPPDLMTLLYPLGNGTSAPPSDLLLRRETIERIGGFEEDFQGIYQLYEDQCFLTKVYLDSPVYVASECWDKYRIHDESCVTTVMSAGRYETVRARYLRWLEKYLAQQKIEHPAIWQALGDAQATLSSGTPSLEEAGQRGSDH